MYDLKRLSDLFPESEIKFRPAPGGKGKLAYIDARAVFDRLDEVVGAENWQTRFDKGPDGGVVAGIGILVVRDDGCEDWIWKWDGAENTKIEEVKGGLSDSIKRAAVQWGIGRYLYKLDKSGKLPKWAIPTDKTVEEREPEGDEPAPVPFKGNPGLPLITQAFAAMGAFIKDLERFCGKPLDSLTDTEVQFLREEYAELKALDFNERKQRIREW